MILSDLIKPFTSAEMIEKFYAAAAARGLPTTSWKSGAVVRTIFAAFGIVSAAFSDAQAKIAAAGFLALSSAGWLTLIARYVYNVERDEGSFATGNVTLNNTAGGVYSLAAGDLVVRNPTTQKTYRNTASISIGAFQTGIVAPIQAIELGSASTSPATTITAFDTPLIGVNVSNPAAVVGNDAEDDPTLITRCLEKTGVASPNGPQDAYGFFARSAKRPDGISIGVKRATTSADGVGNVFVWVAGDSGDTDPGDVALIQTILQENVQPHAVTATVFSATPKLIAVTYELWVRDTTALTDLQIEAQVEARIRAFLSSRPIGGDVISPSAGKVYKNAIVAIIGDTIPDTVRVDVTLPAGDTACLFADAPVIGAVIVTAIHRVAGPVI